MTDKEMRSLKRSDLLNMFIEQSKELEVTKNKAEEMRCKLKKKEIQLEDAGNIAEAALQLNGIFENAQATVQQYLDHVRLMSERQKKTCYDKENNIKEWCNLKEAETKKKCAAMLEETKQRCEKLEEETRKKCAVMEKNAKIEVEKQWAEISEKLEAFYDAHKGLQKLIEVASEVQSE